MWPAIAIIVASDASDSASLVIAQCLKSWNLSLRYGPYAARGTWSMAGNSLDKASLRIALLHASGYAAQYASGTLSLALQKQLILSMFPAQTQLTGSTLSDPADDPTLQSEAATHYWVQFDPGTGALTEARSRFRRRADRPDVHHGDVDV